jgi:hypothetical protein
MTALRGQFLGQGLDHNAHEIALLHDQEFGTVDLDLGRAIPDLEVDRIRPASSRPPRPMAMTSPSLGFSLAVSGMMMPLGGHIFSRDTLDDNAIMQWAELHRCLSELAIHLTCSLLTGLRRVGPADIRRSRTTGELLRC